ncbi:MAG: serine/threonine-protein kinase [Microlunatus sp.]
MLDWLATAVALLETYRLSHSPTWSRLPLTVELLLLSLVPTVLVVVLLNLWLPRQARTITYLTSLAAYVKARPRKPRLWIAGLVPLEWATGIQPWRWGLAGFALIGVGAVWVGQVWRFLESGLGTELRQSADELDAVAPFVHWLVLLLGLLLLALLSARGRMPAIGGARLPVIALWAIVLAGVAVWADRVVPGGTFMGPLLTYLCLLVPALAYWQRRRKLDGGLPEMPAWVRNPYAPGAPQVPVRQVKSKPAPRPAPTQVLPERRSRLQIPNRPLGGATRVQTTVKLGGDPRSVYDAFGHGPSGGPGRGWETVAAGPQPLHRDDPTALGAWQLRGRIAAGGMGIVYLGVRADGTRAAVKVAHRISQAADADLQQRLMREIRVLRSVKVFGVADFLEDGADDSGLWVAMRYIPGPTLSQAISAYGPCTPRYLRLLSFRLAEIIGDLHGAGIMHRDIKPSNIILNERGPFLIDLGISILRDEESQLTGTGKLIGTEAYLSPEVLRGEGFSPAGDVYAWGCVVAYAGAGRPLYSGPFGSLAGRIIDGRWDDGVSRDLIHRDKTVYDLIRRTTSIDPARRPGDGQQLLLECDRRLGRGIGR